MGVELDSVEVEQLSQVLPVPQLLVVPAGKESREYRIHAGAGDREVRQVEGDMILDVHHVVEAEEVAFRNAMLLHSVPVDAGGIDFLRLFLVALDAEAHRPSFQILAEAQRRAY